MSRKTNKKHSKQRKTHKKRGGNIMLSPNATVGTPWGPLPSQWPEQSNGNWYTLNNYNANMPNYRTLDMKGGRKRRKKGGGLFQGLGYNFQSMWNYITTAPQPTNPTPYVQQLK